MRHSSPIDAHLELRHFRYFVVLAEELHFGRAAERLHIVQPALTAQVKSLERQLGVQLFERTKRRVELTEAGREFQRESYKTLAQVRTAIAVVSGFAKGATGTLRVGFGADAAFAGFVTATVRAYRAQWPKVNIILHEMPSMQVSDALASNEIDVGFASMVKGSEPPFEFKTVGTWRWLLAVAETHSLSKAASVSLLEIADENLAVYADADGRSIIAKVLSALEGSAPQPVYTTSHIGSLMAHVSSGLGVAFVPSSATALSFPETVYVQVADALPELEVRLLWRRDTLSQRVSNFVGCIDAHR